MANTTLIRNISDGPVEVTVYASTQSNVRKAFTLDPNASIQVSRVTPEVRALEGSVLEIAPVDQTAAEPSREASYVFVTDPSTDLVFSTAGYAWPRIGDEPLNIDYRDNIRRFVANDKFALLAPRERSKNIDIDWRNCHRGPCFMTKGTLDGDLDVSVNVEADGGLSEYDWAGIVISSVSNPFRFARIGLATRIVNGAPVGVFERVFQGDKEVSDAFYSDGEVGTIDEGGPYDWNEVASGKFYLTSLVGRFPKNGRQFGRMTIRRRGSLLYLIGDDDTDTEPAVVSMVNFIDGPVSIAFAIGRYPSKGSKFQGAVFHGLEGMAEKS